MAIALPTLHVKAGAEETISLRRKRFLPAPAPFPHVTAGRCRLETVSTRKNRPRPLVLNRYELLERIGRGGFSTVYSAYDHKMARQVAVKVVQRTDELTDRASREARAAAKLCHPNIVTVFELSEDENNVYLVSELVDGKTVADRISALSLSDLDCLEIALQTLEALGHAHERGVVHRDIKPDNIMLTSTSSNEVKVMDFGIAQLENTQRITRQGDVVGTLAYMSPEQADGLAVDSATDVYSTALVLYECLTGDNPFRAPTAAETVGRIQAGALPLTHVRPDLPEELSALIEEAMEPDPALRLGRASFAAGIEELLPELGGGQQATTVLRRADRPRRPLFSDLRARGLAVLPRALNALLAGLAAWVIAGAASLYPDTWTIPLALGLALLTGLLPRAGLAALALAAVLPAAVFSPGLGVVLAVLATIYYLTLGLAWPSAALVPVLAAALGYLGIGLTYPALAGALGRLKRGLLLAPLGAVTLTAFQLAAGAGVLAYVGVENSFDITGRLAGEYSPLEALRVLVEPLAAQPVLALQPLIWLLAALPAALLIRRRRLLVDVAGMALSAALLLGGYLALPYLVPGYLLPLDPLMKTLALCVIIQFVLLLVSPRAPHQPPSPHEFTEET